MNLIFHDLDGTRIAELPSGEMQVTGLQEAIDLLGNADYQGASKIVIHKEDLAKEFFNLSTGLAGDILQKFSNYRMRLAIVGDFSETGSKSLKDFIYESNRVGRILFVGTREEAFNRFTNMGR